MLEFGASLIFHLLALKLRPYKHRKVLTDGFLWFWRYIIRFFIIKVRCVVLYELVGFLSCLQSRQESG